MTEAHLTPCGALFAVMKKHGGMSYKELASLVLSGKPLTDGRSPASRVSDRTWVSRFIVHAISVCRRCASCRVLKRGRSARCQASRF